MSLQAPPGGVMAVRLHLPQTAMSAPRPSDVDTTASPPFDEPKVIRSSDNVHFYVHKSLLSMVSPVFEGMCALLNDTSQELYDDRPCLPVSDDGRHLLCLLSWYDPRSERPPSTLDNLEMTLEISDKYGMDSIFQHAQKNLLVHGSVESEPFRTFAIAIRFRLDEGSKSSPRNITTIVGVLRKFFTAQIHICIRRSQPSQVPFQM